jgi:uncharacterized membrane protein
MIWTSAEETWDHIGQVSRAIFDVMAFLIGVGTVALLVTLFVVWLTTRLVERLIPKFFGQ